MFPMTPEKKAQSDLNDRLSKFVNSMVGLVYWHHEPLIEAYRTIERLEARNHELRMLLEAAESRLQMNETNQPAIQAPVP